MSTNLVIGMGQIGSAIHKILSEKHEVEGIDIKDCTVPKHEKYDFVHICFPCKDQTEFVEAVKKYKQRYLAPDGVCIIHATVPVGTSRLCNAVNSPCRGIHPDLVEGIKTFPKFFGGMDPEATQQGELTASHSLEVPTGTVAWMIQTPSSAR